MHKHIFRITIITVSALFLVVCLLLLFTYVFPTESPFIKKTTSFLPAVLVDEKAITVGEIAQNTQAVRNFYENKDYAKGGIRIDFTTRDGQKRLKIIEREVINKLVENAVVEDVATKQGIVVTNEDVAQALKTTLEGGDVEIAKENAGLYGWTLEEFASKVIKPSLYVKALEKNFNEKNQASQEMQEKMLEARKAIEDGRSFADTAMQYSQGFAADKGGAQGIFYRNQLDPALADAAFSLEIGELSEIIETSIGLHLIMIDDKVIESGKEDAISLNHIYLPKKFFSAYLHDEVAKRSINVFLSGYVWGEEENYVVSSNLEMRKFENKIVEDAYQESLSQAQDELEQGEEKIQDQQGDQGAVNEAGDTDSNEKSQEILSDDQL